MVQLPLSIGEGHVPTLSEEHQGMQELQAMPSECLKWQTNGSMPNCAIRAELGAAGLLLLARVGDAQRNPGRGSLRGCITGEVLCHRDGRLVVLHPRQNSVGSGAPGLCLAAAQQNPAVGGGGGVAACPAEEQSECCWRLWCLSLG